MFIIDKMKSRFPVFVRWTGKNDVSPEELGMYIGTILAKMGISIATKNRIDVVELIREEWSE